MNPSFEDSCCSGPTAHVNDESFDAHSIRLSAHSRTFSHPHRVTVFPPFPSPSTPSASKSGRSLRDPLAFVRGLRNRRHGAAEASAKKVRDDDGASSWSSCSIPGTRQEFATFPLASKSRSDHSLHRIARNENAWTVFATLRPPAGNRVH